MGSSTGVEPSANDESVLLNNPIIKGWIEQQSKYTVGSNGWQAIQRRIDSVQRYQHIDYQK